MIDLNDVLLAMSNIPVDDPIAEIWGRGLQGGYKIIEYTGTLPITISVNGDALIDYRIYGASGGGAGEPTENLIDANKPGAQRVELEPNTDYCLCKYTGSKVARPQCDVYDENDNKLFGDYINVWVSYSFTNPSNGAYAIITFLSDVKGKVSFVKGHAANNDTVYPVNYIPYGYKLPMTVGEGNLFDKNAPGVLLGKGFASGSFVILDYPQEFISDFILVKPNTTYVTNSDWSTRAYRANVQSSEAYGTIYTSNTFTTAADENYIRLDGKIVQIDKIYVHELSSIPVYIGENQLGEDEYVSFSEQKIYRDASGTLAPTAPPVPLPEIPTIGGTTIIDYDGDPKPSQMYVKYKGKG